VSGVVPLQVPLFAVRVCPCFAVPVIVGSDVLAGLAAERTAPASADPVVKMRRPAVAASKKNGVRLIGNASLWSDRRSWGGI
jgi:hypothetical protein